MLCSIEFTFFFLNDLRGLDVYEFGISFVVVTHQRNYLVAGFELPALLVAI